jgi:hypothetical protein
MGVVNWMRSFNDSISYNTFDSSYTSTISAKFNWINVDRFYNAPNLVGISVNVMPPGPGSDSLEISAYTAFPSINSLYNIRRFIIGSPLTYKVMDVPANLNTTIVVIGVNRKTKKLLFGMGNAIATNAGTITVKLSEATPKQIHEALDLL